jgi:hypothetical protein
LPVTVAGATGTLVIRTFDVPRRARAGLAFDTFDVEASARGRAVLLLDAERRNRR